MSGTSLDGLDLACCNFYENNEKWSYETIKAVTINYSDGWISRLQSAHQISRKELKKLDLLYGQYLGELTLGFINDFGLNPDFISSHGHTVLHQPEKKLSLQIGNGQMMANTLKLPVVYDFRSLDVSIGGQGAPLVPIGDKLLFNDYDYCINLGGIANTSFDHEGERIAYDICPVNMALNMLSLREGLSYDKDGKLASTGILNNGLLSDLNNIHFYQKTPPKSLSREWFESEFMPYLNSSNLTTIDLLRTVVEHIAIQIAHSINKKDGVKVLMTGGGALNTFLTKRIQNLSKADIRTPSLDLINFKEAIIFGFLGVLRMRKQVNCLKSVTGASRDSSGGKISWP